MRVSAAQPPLRGESRQDLSRDSPERPRIDFAVKPDLITAGDELECEQYGDDLEDVRRGARRQGKRRHAHQQHEHDREAEGAIAVGWRGTWNLSGEGVRGHQAAISAAPRSSGAHSASPSELDLPTDRDRPVARQPEVLSGLG